MREWKVPVVAVGVVHEGRTILARGYGLRDVRRRLPVTEHTVFAIGSCTKAITATAIGILVDEGKLQWDAPIRQYVPSFRLFDPVATEQCTLRDLLCQRTGLPRHDMIWEGQGSAARSCSTGCGTSSRATASTQASRSCPSRRLASSY